MHDQLYEYIEHFSINFYVASVKLIPRKMFFLTGFYMKATLAFNELIDLSKA